MWKKALQIIFSYISESDMDKTDDIYIEIRVEILYLLKSTGFSPLTLMEPIFFLILFLLYILQYILSLDKEGDVLWSNVNWKSWC